VTTEKTHPFFIVDRINHTLTTVLGLATLLFLILLGDHVIRTTREEQKQASKDFEDNQNAILNLLDDISSLADGDLTKEVRVSEDITGAIADSINYTVEELRNLVATIQTSAKQVNETSSKTQALTGSLAETNDTNKKLISTSTGAIANVAKEVVNMAENATDAATMADLSATTAKDGAEIVRQSISAMNNVREQIQETSKRIKRLGESSQEIGDILEIITDIADQTNLLALNAAMQAAAGEAGRGFAVVADEVQRLAERSTRAALQIDTLIKAIQTDTGEAIESMESSTAEVVSGADNIEKAGDSLHKIETTSDALAKVITQLSAQAQRQRQETDEISKTMAQVHDATDKTAKETREAVTLITQLAGLSVTLEESVSGFKLTE
jgi:twitching motility protein PilJ